MSDAAASAAVQVQHLREVLQQTAAALASGSLAGLLVTESALERALVGVSTLRLEELTGAERQALRRDVEQARLALERCRRLGTGVDAFVRISFEAHGLATGYAPSSSRRAASAGGERDAAAGMVGREIQQKA